jgi:hypothetical protein
MEETRTTFAAELAAELELSLPAAADALAQKLRLSEQLRQRLAASGIVRQYAVPRHDTTTLDVTGVAVSSTTLPAFGGLLYGTSIHAHRLKLAQRSILEASEQVRVHVGDLDYYESGQRLRWKHTQHTYELLDELVTSPEPPQVVLLDLPIFVSRGEEANREQIEEVQEEWLEMVDGINQFWRARIDRLLPINSSGILIASVRKQAGFPLFIAVHNNAQTSPDEVNPDLSEFFRSEWTHLRQAGMSRLLDSLLSAHTRTIAYAFEDLQLDPRWQPYELHHSGILGFYLRVSAQAPVWHVQVVGHRTQWTTAMLDHLALAITKATLSEGERAEPLPLWYARRLAKFPQPMLMVFRDLAQERISMQTAGGTIP